jgi:2-methylcitrate dehydratase PrpD
MCPFSTDGSCLIGLTSATRLGREFMITRRSFKTPPAEALTCQPVPAALRISQERGLAAADVAGVQAETTARTADILADPGNCWR